MLSESKIIAAVPELPHIFKRRRAPGKRQATARDPMFDMASPCNVAVEIGSQWGWWPRRAARCLPEATIYSVDLFPCTKPTDQSYKDEVANVWEWALNVRQWLGDRVFGLWGASRVWARKFREVEKRPIDLLFIDADHYAESVYEDCYLWTPLVRPGGLICGHDWGGMWGHEVREGVLRYFEGRAEVKADRIFYSGRRARIDLGLCWWIKKWAGPKEST